MNNGRPKSPLSNGVMSLSLPAIGEEQPDVNCNSIEYADGGGEDVSSPTGNIKTYISVYNGRADQAVYSPGLDVYLATLSFSKISVEIT